MIKEPYEIIAEVLSGEPITKNEIFNFTWTHTNAAIAIIKHDRKYVAKLIENITLNWVGSIEKLEQLKNLQMQLMVTE